MRRVLLLSSLCALTGVVFASAPATPEKLPPSTVVVSQGGARLTLGDVDTYAKEIPADKRTAVFNSPQRIEDILRGLLVRRQLAREAMTAEHSGSDAQGAELSRAQYLVLAQARVDELRSSLEERVPDMAELAHERYLANPQDFATARRVDVRHILISTADRSDSEARDLANRLYRDLQHDPSEFQKDVEKYSDDKSKKDNHGLIEFANSERTVKPFREAADGLEKVGDITPPVKTRFGYHILKAVQVTPARQPTFAEVKDELIAKLRKNWVAKRVQNHLDGLRSKEIDANPAAIASLRTRYQDAGKDHRKVAPAQDANTKGQSPN